MASAEIPSTAHSYPLLNEVFSSRPSRLKAFPNEPLKNRLERSLKHEHHVVEIAERSIANYELSTKNTALLLKGVSTMIAVAMVVIILFSSVVSIFCTGFYWVPWAAVGGIITLAFIKSFISYYATSIEKNYEALRIMMGMLKNRELRVINASHLPASYRHLKSDQMLKKEIEKNRPLKPEEVKRISEEYDLEIDCAAAVNTAASFALFVDPLSRKKWDAIKDHLQGVFKVLGYALFKEESIKKNLLKSDFAAYEKKLAEAQRGGYGITSSFSAQFFPLENLYSFSENPLAYLKVRQKWLQNFETELFKNSENGEAKSCFELYEEGTELYSSSLSDWEELLQENEKVHALLAWMEAQQATEGVKEENVSLLDLLSENDPFSSYFTDLIKANNLSKERISGAESEFKRRVLEANTLFERRLSSIFEGLVYRRETVEQKLVEWIDGHSTNVIERGRRKILEIRGFLANPEEKIRSLTGMPLADRGPILDVLRFYAAPRRYPWLEPLIHLLEKEAVDSEEVESFLTSNRNELEVLNKQREAASVKFIPKIDALEKQFTELVTKISPEAEQESLNKELQALHLFYYKKIVPLSEQVKARPTTQRIQFFIRALIGRSPPLNFRMTEVSSPFHVDRQRRVDELKAKQLLKNLDTQMMWTYRLRRFGLEWAAMTVILLVEVLFFGNPWVALGISCTIVGMMIGRSLVDWRIRVLEKRKNALKLEIYLRNPGPWTKELFPTNLEALSIPANREKAQALQKNPMELMATEKTTAQLLTYGDTSLTGRKYRGSKDKTLTLSDASAKYRAETDLKAVSERYSRATEFTEDEIAQHIEKEKRHLEKYKETFSAKMKRPWKEIKQGLLSIQGALDNGQALDRNITALIEDLRKLCDLRGILCNENAIRQIRIGTQEEYKNSILLAFQIIDQLKNHWEEKISHAHKMIDRIPNTQEELRESIQFYKSQLGFVEALREPFARFSWICLLKSTDSVENIARERGLNLGELSGHFDRLYRAIGEFGEQKGELSSVGGASLDLEALNGRINALKGNIDLLLDLRKMVLVDEEIALLESGNRIREKQAEGKARALDVRSELQAVKKETAYVNANEKYNALLDEKRVLLAEQDVLFETFSSKVKEVETVKRALAKFSQIAKKTASERDAFVAANRDIAQDTADAIKERPTILKIVKLLEGPLTDGNPRITQSIFAKLQKAHTETGKTREDLSPLFQGVYYELHKLLASKIKLAEKSQAIHQKQKEIDAYSKQFLERPNKR